MEGSGGLGLVGMEVAMGDMGVAMEGTGVVMEAMEGMEGDMEWAWVWEWEECMAWAGMD